MERYDPTRWAIPENNSLLDRLIFVDGKLAGQTIINTVIENPSINKLFNFGAPGIGKTTLATLLAMKLYHESHGEIEPELVRHDDIAGELVKRSGKYFDEWTSDDWSIFNETLFKHWMSQSLTEADGVRRVKIIETVGVGHTTPRDRGVSALNLAARETSEDDSGLYICYANDFQVQHRAIEVRREARHQNDSDIETFLLYNFNIAVKNIRNSEYNRARAVGRGRILRKLIEGGARAKHINAIDQEMEEQAESLFTPKNYNDIIHFPLPPNLRPLRMDLAHFSFKFQGQGFVLENRLRNELSLPEDRGLLVVNSFDPNRLIYWYVDEEVDQSEGVA